MVRHYQLCLQKVLSSAPFIQNIIKTSTVKLQSAPLFRPAKTKMILKIFRHTYKFTLLKSQSGFHLQTVT